MAIEVRCLLEFLSHWGFHLELSTPPPPNVDAKIRVGLTRVPIVLVKVPFASLFASFYSNASISLSACHNSLLLIFLNWATCILGRAPDSGRLSGVCASSYRASVFIFRSVHSPSSYKADLCFSGLQRRPNVRN